MKEPAGAPSLEEIPPAALAALAAWAVLPAAIGLIAVQRRDVA